MNWAPCRFLPEVVGEESGQRDPEGVDEDRDRNSGRDQQKLDPQHAPLEEVGENDAQGDKGHQTSQATAGFVHEELGVSEVNDVAFDEGWNAEFLKTQHCELGGHQLKREGDGVHQRLRQRHHQEEEEQGESENPKNLSA